MLAPKKIKKKKIISYIFIMVIMLGGTVFFAIKNYKLATESSSPNFDPIEEFEKGENNITGKNENIEKSEFLKASEQIVDSELLDEEKFNRLKENTTSIKDFTIGKKNLFEPY